MAEKDASPELADDNTEAAETTWSQDDPAPEKPDKTDPPDDEGDDPPDDDAAGDEPDEGDDAGDPPPAEAAPRSRARDRIQRLERERDEARRAATDAEARANATRNADVEQRARADRAADEARERALMEQMSEGERAQYVIAKEVKRTQDRQDRIEREIADNRDAGNFSRRVATDPVAQRYADRVEREAEKLRNQGIFTSRDAILTYLVGDAVLKGEHKAATSQRKAAKARVEGERAPARRAATDVAAARGRGGSAVSRMERDDPRI